MTRADSRRFRDVAFLFALGMATVLLLAVPVPTLAVADADLGLLDSTITQTNPSGSVTVEQNISADQETIRVDVSFSNTTGEDAVLQVVNENTSQQIQRTVTANGTVQIDVSNLGGIERGDTLTAKLFETSSLDVQLAEDSASVGDAVFDVVGVITLVNGSVTEGETVDVLSEIENVGEIDGTQTIELEVIDADGTTVFTDSTEITVTAGDSEGVSFAYETQKGDAPELTFRVSSADDSNTTSVGVEPADEPEFSVALQQVDGPVTEGDTINATSQITNVGGTNGTQTIEFAVTDSDGQTVFTDSTEVTLDSGESRTVEFAYQSSEGDAPEVTLSVASGNATDSATVQVEPEGEASFSVDLVSVPATVTAGETLSVQSEITNVGDAEATQTIEFGVVDSDGQTVFTETREVSLGAGESQGVEFSYETQESDPPAIDLRVASENDSETASVDVETAGQAEFIVDLVSVPATVTAGETLSAESEITNVGDAEATQTVEFEVVDDGGATVFTDTREVTLGVGETETVAFSYQTGNDDVPQLELSIASGDDSASASVNVESGGEGVLSVSPPTVTFNSTSVAETRSKQVRVENVGNASLTVDSLSIEGPNAAAFSTSAEQFDLDPDGQAEFSVQFSPTSAGNQTATLLFRDETGEILGEVELSGEAETDISGIGGGGDDDDDGEDDDGEDGDGEDDDGEDEDGDQDVEEKAEIATNKTSVSVSIDNAISGETLNISIPEPEQIQDYHMQNISVTPAVNANLTVNLTTSSGTLETTPDGEFAFNKTKQVGNLSVEANIDNEAIAETEFLFRINESRLDALNTTREDVAFYQYNGTTGQWEERETEFVRQEGDQLFFRGIGDGFSDWTAAAKRPDLDITDTRVDVRTATTEDEITIQVFVTNTGGADGTYEAELLTNQQVVEREDAIVPSNSTVLINFLRTFDQAGVYEVQVNDVSVGEIEISEDDEEVNVTTPTPTPTPEPGEGGDGGTDQGADDGTGEETGDGTDEGTPADGSTETPGVGEESGDGGVLDGFGPGFGPMSALLAILVGTYLLHGRRE